jgi:hypothetical protein
LLTIIKNNNSSNSKYEALSPNLGTTKKKKKEISKNIFYQEQVPEHPTKVFSGTQDNPEADVRF